MKASGSSAEDLIDVDSQYGSRVEQDANVGVLIMKRIDNPSTFISQNVGGNTGLL